MICRALCLVVFFVKQKTAYEMRISDGSSDVCSSDLDADQVQRLRRRRDPRRQRRTDGKPLYGGSRTGTPQRDGDQAVLTDGEPEKKGRRSSSDERRVGKEGVMTCSTQWCPSP